MLLSHVVCAVETYRIESNRPGAFGDELRVEGWLLTEEELRALDIRFADGRVIAVHDHGRASEGVQAHFGQFGERAGRARFLLLHPLGLDEWDFRSAVLHAEIMGGASFAWPIGHLFEESRPSTFSTSESALIMKFESMGDTCEFGLVQRLVGQERLSFLRYAGVGDVFKLADHIGDNLRILDSLECVVITQHGHEWIASVPAINLAFHTGRSVDSISAERIREEEWRKLAFMGQKFIEDCEAGEKTFVYRVLRDARGGPDGTRGMDALHDALRRHGPARLLWINEADAAHRGGTVVHQRDGLYRGWIDHLAPHEDAFDHRPRLWLDLLATADARMAER